MPDLHEAMNRCKVAIDEMQRQIQAKVEAADMVSECTYHCLFTPRGDPPCFYAA